MIPVDATPPENVFPTAFAAGANGGVAVRHVERTGSTNSDLADEARSGKLDPCVLVADLQTAGRGRLDRVWDAPEAQHLLMSFRLPAAPEQAGPAVVVVAAAVRRAAEAVTAASVGFKWPNDLLIEGGARPGKLAGVLAEYVPGTPGAVIVGVGLNVGPIDREGATSLTALGSQVDRDTILRLVLENLADLRAEPSLALDELRARSLTLGRVVRVELPDGSSVKGTAIDLGPAGELVVDVAGERRSFHVGDVVHLRPA